MISSFSFSLFAQWSFLVKKIRKKHTHIHTSHFGICFLSQLPQLILSFERIVLVFFDVLSLSLSFSLSLPLCRFQLLQSKPIRICSLNLLMHYFQSICKYEITNKLNAIHRCLCRYVLHLLLLYLSLSHSIYLYLSLSLASLFIHIFFQSFVVYVLCVSTPIWIYLF